VAAAGVVAHQLHHEQTLEGTDPWSRRDGWRLPAAARRRIDLALGGEHHGLRWRATPHGALRLSLADQHWPLHWRAPWASSATRCCWPASATCWPCTPPARRWRCSASTAAWS
jgi:hypothetical protein